MKRLRLCGGEYSESWEEHWEVPDDFTYAKLADILSAAEKPKYDDHRHSLVGEALKSIGGLEIISDFEVDIYEDTPWIKWLASLRDEK